MYKNHDTKNVPKPRYETENINGIVNIKRMECKFNRIHKNRE